MNEAFPKELVGKTIVGVDDTCVNVLKLKMADGTVFNIYAECGSSPYNFPFFEIYKGEECLTLLQQHQNYSLKQRKPLELSRTA